MRQKYGETATRNTITPEYKNHCLHTNCKGERSELTIPSLASFPVIHEIKLILFCFALLCFTFGNQSIIWASMHIGQEAFTRYEY